MTGKGPEVFCPGCEDYRAVRTETRNETYTVRGEKITVPVEAQICCECGETIGSDDRDQAILDAVYVEYRRRKGLLSPDRIKAIRKRYHLSQKALATLLGMSEATINRYEQGGLQNQAHDTAIRACERPDMIRDLLERRGHLLTDQQHKRVEQALQTDVEPAYDSVDEIVDLPGEAGWISMPQEVTDRTGYRRFDYARFAAVVVWFCKQLGSVSRTTVNKLLFYADFLNFKTTTVSLTGAAYRRLDYGPVLADYDGLLSRMESDGFLISQEVEYPRGFTGLNYSAGPEADRLVSRFTPTEQAVLTHVANTLGHLNAQDISRRSHKETAWQNTSDREIISYALATHLSLSLP